MNLSILIEKLSRYRSGSFFILLPLILTFGSCKHSNETETTEQKKFTLSDSLLQTLEIDTVHSCKIINAISLNGQVTFNEDSVVRIYPLVSGIVQDVKVMLGDYVQKGQVLAEVRSAEMAGFSNDLVNGEANLSVAKKSLDATEDLYKGGLASEKDYITAQSNYRQAESALNKAKEVIQINGGGGQGNYIVKAPISGFVVEKLVTNNMTIRADNGNNMFTIGDLKTVWVIANVYESNIPDVHADDSVAIATLSYPKKTFHGKVDKILNVLDPTNKVMKVRIVIPNPDYLLKPQMYAGVTLISSTNNEMPCIPAKSLVFDHSQNYVLIFKDKSNMIIQPVEVENTINDRAYISKGLTEGDRIMSTEVLMIYHALNN